ncbi:MAG: hypothetical protein L0Z62_31400 [Gemmataceae bacterium]|nr:hypothetical protein [Gemmataceae bacterium]
MEPRQEEKQKKTNEPRPQEKKPKRFRIVKLEERIAPSGGGNVAGGNTSKMSC